MSVALTVGAAVALSASVMVAIVLPKHVGTSEEQERYDGHEVED